MKSLKIAALCVLLALAFTTEVKEEDDVLVLTTSNFDDVIAKNQYVLVEFYAPWCGHCKSLAPEYAKAAKTLKTTEPRVPLGKVDATVESELAKRYDVNGYPTLKFFINGEAVEYNGGRTEDTIVNWIKKKSGPSTVTVNTAAELEKLTQDNKVVVVHFGAQGTAEYEAFDKVSKTNDDVIFASTEVEELRTANEAAVNGVVMLRNFEEPRLVYTGELADLKSWIDTNAIATVIEFDQKAAEMIFGEGKPTLFVFYKENDEVSDKAVAALKEVSAQLKGKILMSTSQTVRDIGKRLAEYIGVEGALPTVRIVNPTPENILKYEMTTEITPESLVKFTEDYLSGSLKPGYKSEEVPEKNDGPVKVVVGKNWEELVLDTTKDVLVKYYAPWCGHCKTLAPIYDKLGDKLKSNPNLVIAKMDSTANEVEGVSIQGFPTLKFYPAKDKTPVDFDGDRTEEGMLKFLKEKTSFDWVDLDSQKTDL